MKSEIKIDFIDRGTGKGIEPVIRVEIRKSEDPRDTLISHLFQSLSGQSFLELHYSNHKHITTDDHLPDMEKTVVLFKPELDTDELMSVVRTCFHEWCLKNGWSISIANIGSPNLYSKKKGEQNVSEEILFADFLSEKATHKSN